MRLPLVVLTGVVFLTGLAAPAHAAEHGRREEPLAATPPMGWNSWNRFGCAIDEDLIRRTADALVSSGMRDAGYDHVNIDDCWMAPERDAEGRLQADPDRFPSGIRALADYVHARGMRLGIYSSAGTRTCQGLPASLDHEEVDARTFAEWQVDYLKYDNCDNLGRPAFERYLRMGEALRATGRPIVYSICEWGENAPWEWGREVGGNLWRTTQDIKDTWDSVLGILDRQARAGGALRAGRVERPGHAGGRQRRHVRVRVPRALLVVGAPQRAAHRGQRRRGDVRGDAAHPAQPRPDRGQPGLGRDAGTPGA
nr:hypothetical protein GCM10020241_58420 [Streptoalloteichus tenebrarius]